MGAIGYVSAIDAAAVRADPEGTAAAAVAAHTAAVDPHADRAYTDDEIDAAEAGFVTSARTITAGTGLTGGGDLSANRTISANVGTGAGTLAAGDHGHTAAAVGADPAGTAAAAVGAHVLATDPHGDRGYADGQVTALASSTTTALGGKANSNHQHAAADVTSGTLAIGRIPVGTSSSTVAQGDHNHSGVYSPTAHTHDPAAPVAPTGYGTGASNSGSPYYDVGTIVEAGGKTARGRGRVALASNYTAGAQIMTLDGSAWPAREVAVPCRIVGVGAANGALTITTTGVVSYSGNITVGAGTALLFDGVTWTLTA